MVDVSATFVPGADTCDDLREQARRVLPGPVWEHVVLGAGDERTTAANRAGFGHYRLRARVLRDVSVVDTSVEVLGTKLEAPIFTCPTGQISLVHDNAEREVARGAAQAGAGFILSGSPSISLEDVAAVAGPARWNQLYWQGDTDIMSDLVERSEIAGYRAIVLTVDSALSPRRPRMIRSGLRFPAEQHATNFKRYLTPEWQARVATDKFGRPARMKGLNFAHELNWDHVEWLKSICHVPVVLKGIRHAQDALRAVEAGVDGIIVSNHGGRILDGEPGTIEVLEEIVKAVAGHLTILIDGGIRRPADIAIALGLGAAAVGLGSPVVFALACGGEETVGAFLEDMAEGLRNTLGLMGISRITELTREYVSLKDEFLSDAGLKIFPPPLYD